MTEREKQALEQLEQARLLDQEDNEAWKLIRDNGLTDRQMKALMRVIHEHFHGED